MDRCKSQWRTGWLAVAVWAAANGVEAQQFRLNSQSGPYYVGEPVVVQIVAEGLTTQDQPICRLQNAPPPELRVDGPQMQSVGSFMQIINGRVTANRSSLAFNFVVTATEEGEFQVGPFELEYGGQTRLIEGTAFRFRKLENDPDMEISMSLPGSSFYVGQRVPVTIRWAFAGELRDVNYAYRNLEIRSPLFDQFRFLDDKPTGRTTMGIATAEGPVEIDVQVSEERRDGREFIVVTGKRTLIADRVGDFDAISISCRTKKATGWRQDFFGDVRVAGSSRAIAAGQPVSFSIRPLPVEGRPDSFSGAVGRGFSMEVAANRTVVRVGDPISLSVSIRGDGNLENVSLPPLSADGGMDEDRFQLPQDRPPGTLDGKMKQFNVNVRVNDVSVTQIPALAYSWFDPFQEKYVTTRSKPIALDVMPAQVVSADDVVSASPGNRGESASSAGNGEAGTGGQDRSASSRPVSFNGANLAIETDPDKLLGGARRVIDRGLYVTGFYLAGVLAMLAALVGSRRADVDPQLVEKQRQLKKLRNQMVAAAQLPPREAGEQIADSLRQVVALCHPADRRSAEALIGECEKIVYAPDSQQPQVNTDDLTRRSLAVFDEIGVG